jgi:hypothetical protein
MKFVNLTPHAVTLVDNAGTVFATVAPSGQLARVKTVPRVVGTVEIDGHSVPVRVNDYGPLEGLPDPAPDTCYIVSLLAASAAARLGRTEDLLVPDDTVRNDAGRVLGCRAFGRQA